MARPGISTQSYTARSSQNVLALRRYSPSLSAFTFLGVEPVKAIRFEPTETASRSEAFSHFLLAPSHTCQLVIPSGEMALLTAWYQPRFWPSSSRFPMFHVPPGAYHIITFGIPTIS